MGEALTEKPYTWTEGAQLGEHSHRKHKILREYVANYFDVRCRVPQQSLFKLAIIDGFAGGGRYSGGEPGSPIIFLEETIKAFDAVNTRRLVEGFGKELSIECTFILNDADPNAIAMLREHLAPFLAENAEHRPRLKIVVEYFNERFESAYPKIKTRISRAGCRNVLFNLDQCGHVAISRDTIMDITHSYPSAEVFFTFAIGPWLAFLPRQDQEKLQERLQRIGLPRADFQDLGGMVSKERWLGIAENSVFNSLKICAPYVSPFSINHPGGWQYWLIHFANNRTARQVYNRVLHENASLQAHFGRSGLNMLAYNPVHEGSLYLFDDSGRKKASEQLYDDIPRFIGDGWGDAISAAEFFEHIYKDTPAHTDDINAAIIANPDVEVITPAGGKRRSPNTISPQDIIRLKRQSSFFTMF